MMTDVFGQALLDFYNDTFQSPLLLHNDYGPPEIIPIEHYFVDYEDYSDLELCAMDHIRGKTLDVGSATGRHVIHLQDVGIDATAMDSSQICTDLMRQLGVDHIITDDIYNYQESRFDSISMLMNGIGIAGNISGLKKLLTHLENILTPGGQVIADSSDIRYLYEDEPLPAGNYFGELNFHYEYKMEIGEAFKWLYIDPDTLSEVAQSVGWSCQILFEDNAQAYLARLQLL